MTLLAPDPIDALIEAFVLAVVLFIWGLLLRK